MMAEETSIGLVVFDCDGTLVDSAPDIRAAINRMLADEGQPDLDLPTITSFIGNGLPKLVERVMTRQNMDMAQFHRISADVLQIYETASTELTRPYPGMLATLKTLKSTGYRLGVCTNKPFGPAVHLLTDMALDGFFDVVIGGDSTDKRKPDPLPLQEALRALNASDVLYVGDSEIDAETAVNAGVAFALFTEGYRKRPVSQIPHDFAFSDFDLLPGIVQHRFDTVS